MLRHGALRPPATQTRPRLHLARELADCLFGLFFQAPPQENSDAGGGSEPVRFVRAAMEEEQIARNDVSGEHDGRLPLPRQLIMQIMDEN